MKYIFHRGYHQTKTEENKLVSFIKGLENQNSIGIETDIRQTKDQVFVLYHDPLFKGKLVNKCLYKEMKKENIPTLNDLLKIKTEKILLLEIKDFNIDVPKLIKTLNKYKRNIYLMSFNNGVIAKIKKLNTSYKIGVLNYVFNSSDSYTYDFICLLNDLITPTMLKRFKDLNISVISYGVRSIKSCKYSSLIYIVNNEILKDT